jgi:hypothetical protein
MNAVGEALREVSSGHERRRDYRGRPVGVDHDLRRPDPLLTAGLVAHRAREVAVELLFPFGLLSEYVLLPFEKGAYDTGVHGKEAHVIL